MKLMDYYAEENEKDYDDGVLPTIKPEQTVLLHLLEKLTLQLEEITLKVTKPIMCCCFRHNCFGLVFKNVYHSNEQLEHMLEQNFDGRQIFVKA